MQILLSLSLSLYISLDLSIFIPVFLYVILPVCLSVPLPLLNLVYVHMCYLQYIYLPYRLFDINDSLATFVISTPIPLSAWSGQAGLNAAGGDDGTAWCPWCLRMSVKIEPEANILIPLCLCNQRQLAPTSIKARVQHIQSRAHHWGDWLRFATAVASGQTTLPMFGTTQKPGW